MPSGRAAMRLHRSGYRTKAEILSELHWTLGLAQAGYPAPRPVTTLDEKLIHTTIFGQFVTVIEWIVGAPIGDGDVAFNATPAELGKLYFGVGALLGRLHNETDAWCAPSGFSRPKWDRAGLTGADPLWGKYWQTPGLNDAETALICAARDKANEILRDFDDIADVGLIHADALRENIFETDNGLALIDFDDAGVGYRMYELGACLTQSVDEPAYPEMVTALLDGYADVRNLCARSRQLYPMFAMLRSFGALGWTIPRLSPDHPNIPRYVRRALMQAHEFLDTPL